MGILVSGQASTLWRSCSGSLLARNSGFVGGWSSSWVGEAKRSMHTVFPATRVQRQAVGISGLQVSS